MYMYTHVWIMCMRMCICTYMYIRMHSLISYVCMYVLLCTSIDNTYMMRSQTTPCLPLYKLLLTISLLVLLSHIILGGLHTCLAKCSHPVNENTPARSMDFHTTYDPKTNSLRCKLGLVLSPAGHILWKLSQQAIE